MKLGCYLLTASIVWQAGCRAGWSPWKLKYWSRVTKFSKCGDALFSSPRRLFLNGQTLVGSVENLSLSGKTAILGLNFDVGWPPWILTKRTKQGGRPRKQVRKFKGGLHQLRTNVAAVAARGGTNYDLWLDSESDSSRGESVNFAWIEN